MHLYRFLRAAFFVEIPGAIAFFLLIRRLLRRLGYDKWVFEWQRL